MKKEKIDKVALYKGNAKQTFFGGFHMESSDNPLVDIVVAGLHLTLLPLTLTLGAGGKTLIDIWSRHPLYEEDKSQLKISIEKLKLNGGAFDRVIEQIVKYPGQSKASSELIRGLKTLEDKEWGSLNEFKQNIMDNSIRSKIQRKFKHRKVDDMAGANTQALSPFTEVELKEFEQQIELYRSITTSVNRREAQVKLLINYLNQTENIGKKLENIIFDEVEHAISSFKL